jgi:hypothetical protein
MTVTLSSTTNTGVIPSTSLLAVGFFDIQNGSLFTSTSSFTARAILTDSSWVAPTFSTSPGITTYNFTSNTTAEVGSFIFSLSGNDSIGFSAVPEPATYAVLFGLSVLGLAAYRRRRPVA